MNLIKEAQDVLKNAYAPYSKFQVGCALETSSGNVFTGCNVENASYGATLCAERNAIGQAIASGQRGLTRLALVCSTEEPCVPCGICLQVLGEFVSSSFEISSSNQDGTITKRYTFSELLPRGFSKNALPAG